MEEARKGLITETILKDNRTRQSKQFESLNFNLETCSREEGGDDYGGDRGDKGDRDL